MKNNVYIHRAYTAVTLCRLQPVSMKQFCFYHNVTTSRNPGVFTLLHNSSPVFFDGLRVSQHSIFIKNFSQYIQVVQIPLKKISAAILKLSILFNTVIKIKPK